MDNKKIYYLTISPVEVLSKLDQSIRMVQKKVFWSLVMMGPGEIIGFTNNNEVIIKKYWGPENAFPASIKCIVNETPNGSEIIVDTIAIPIMNKIIIGIVAIVFIIISPIWTPLLFITIGFLLFGYWLHKRDEKQLIALLDKIFI